MITICAIQPSWIGWNIASKAMAGSSTYNGLTVNKPSSWPSSEPP